MVLIFFQPIPENLFIVAACNPHRGNSLASHKTTWMKGTYYVRSLHPTLRHLMWDYGSLDQAQERDYINEKMTMVNKTTMSPLEVHVFTLSYWHRYYSFLCRFPV